MDGGLSYTGSVDEFCGIEADFFGDGNHQTREGVSISFDVQGCLEFESGDSIRGRNDSGELVGHREVVSVGFSPDVIRETEGGEMNHASRHFVAVLLEIELEVAGIDPGSGEVVRGSGEGIDGSSEEPAVFEGFERWGEVSTGMAAWLGRRKEQV